MCSFKFQWNHFHSMKSLGPAGLKAKTSMGVCLFAFAIHEIVLLWKAYMLPLILLLTNYWLNNKVLWNHFHEACHLIKNLKNTNLKKLMGVGQLGWKTYLRFSKDCGCMFAAVYVALLLKGWLRGSAGPLKGRLLAPLPSSPLEDDRVVPRLSWPWPASTVTVQGDT